MAFGRHAEMGLVDEFLQRILVRFDQQHIAFRQIK
jgi:hypothetical protein